MRTPHLLFLTVILIALALRLPRLEQRPLHGDEAVHAIKFGALLEEGFYRYDSHEYHGPTLNYLTLIPAWLSSAQTLTDISESTLRIVPVFFGIVLIALLLLITDGLSWPAALVAALLAAISPALVFYSRYYIQEMLLVCFTFGAIASGYRYFQNRKLAWALATGLFLGLMYATKETCILAYGAMLLALALTVLMGRKQNGTGAICGSAIKPWHGVAALAVAAAISALFYSSFFSNPAGILDSILAYKTYLGRAGHNEWHVHPWTYYLQTLTFFRIAGGPIWSEGLIILLAAVGFGVAMMKTRMPAVDFHLLRFVAFYTTIMTAVYAIIPYKTPWNLLGFFHGMILLAGVGAVAIVRLQPTPLRRVMASLLLIAAGAHLGWQAYLSSYKYFADPENPYVYAHPTVDVITMSRRVEEVSLAHPDGHDMHIQVICPNDDYWPLPWYLRSFSHVGWWNRVEESAPPAPLIIASPAVEPALLRKLYELPPPGKKNLYVPLFDSYMELRPQVELRGYVTKDLWDRFQQQQARSPQ